MTTGSEAARSSSPWRGVPGNVVYLSLVFLAASSFVPPVPRERPERPAAGGFPSGSCCLGAEVREGWSHGVASGTLGLHVMSPSPASPTRWCSVPVPAGGRGRVVRSLTCRPGTVTRPPRGQLPRRSRAVRSGTSARRQQLCPLRLSSCERTRLSQGQWGHRPSLPLRTGRQSLSSSRGPGPCSAARRHGG